MKFCINRTLPLFCLLTLFSSAVISKPIELEVQGKGLLQKTVKLHPKVEITIHLQNYKAKVIDAKGNTQLLGNYEPDMRGNSSVLVDDFNFDGYKDLALQQAIGYMGVNVFYDVYLYQPKQQLFKLGFHDSNIEADAAAKVIKASQRSGPRWYSNIYKISKGKPYVWQARTAMVGDGLDKVEYKNPKVKILKTVIDDTSGTAAIRTITTKRAHFHNKPSEQSKTRIYVIKGDKVKVLDYTDDVDTGEWFYVSYQGKKKVFKGWVKWKSTH